MREYVKVMKALSDPNRVGMLKLLQGRELCVCELRFLLELAQPTVSKHLKVLEDAGLVEYRKEGSWIIYRPALAGRATLAGEMLALLETRLNDTPRIRELRARLPEINGMRRCAA